MTSTYATVAQLEARLSPAYTMPANDVAEQLLVKASELVDFATMGRAEAAHTSTATSEYATRQKLAVMTATCDQVEFWLEVGEEHDVEGLRGAYQGGRVQIQRLPGYLGQRALRTLLHAGLYWAGVAAR